MQHCQSYSRRHPAKDFHVTSFGIHLHSAPGDITVSVMMLWLQLMGGTAARLVGGGTVITSGKTGKLVLKNVPRDSLKPEDFIFQ